MTTISHRPQRLPARHTLGTAPLPDFGRIRERRAGLQMCLQGGMVKPAPDTAPQQRQT